MDKVFGMDRVNITITTTCKGPSKQESVGYFLIEHVKPDGTPETKDGHLYRESITGKTLTLQLLSNALYILSKTEKRYNTIEVHLEDEYVESAFTNKWIDKWKESEWTNAKGKPLKDAEIWESLFERMSNLTDRFIVTTARSSYSSLMKSWSEDRLKSEQRLSKYHENREKGKENDS